MNKTIVLALLAATVAMPFVATAATDQCDSGEAFALGVVEISPTNDPTATFYVDDRNYALGNGIWIYQETNGIFGGNSIWQEDLQRGGVSPYMPDDPEICVDDPDVLADTLFF